MDTRVDEELLENLLIEMAQTERSSTLQPRRECGQSDVAEFFARWLDERQPLVADCQRAVTWFAAHTNTASERAG